ncbi:MAG: ABC transporter ATP-binding protein [Deltaproteobacteria bacterium]|jgi:ABC-type uncharacterized transport system ATPase subunit|nr:ABC transporter ATP-binding protein [Deltaproteobacteria bacterium]
MSADACKGKPLIRLEGISKHFGKVRANHDITLDIRAGRIKALLGENGAGKSTLMSVLAGRLQPDAGRILLGGNPVFFRSPRDAHQAGIGMVYQHFMLIDSMSVADNVLLGQEKSLTLNPRDMQRRVAELARRYGLDVDPAAKIGTLSMGERQRVEILKLLCRESRLLIFDEPTAVLTPGEARRLFVSMRSMAEQGKAIVFISHKLPEVLEISDEISILRRGEVVDGFERANVPGEAELARRMLGRDLSLNSGPEAAHVAAPANAPASISRADPAEAVLPGLEEEIPPPVPEPRPMGWLGTDRQLSLEAAIYNRSQRAGENGQPEAEPAVPGDGNLNIEGVKRRGRGKLVAETEPVLALAGVNCRVPDSAGLTDIALSVAKGQILAILGVAGNGQKELVEIICGLRRADSGRVSILGRDVREFHANQPSRGGLGYIPEDRRGSAACPDLNLVDNFLLTTRKLFSRWGIMDYKRARQVTRRVISEHNVQPDDSKVLARALSGGNLQKLIVGRELVRNPRCIVAENPTQGLDVAATEEVWQRLRVARETSGVLLVTGDLNEGLTLADYLAVMYRGRIVDIFSIHNQAKVEQIGLMMAGAIAARQDAYGGQGCAPDPAGD